MTARKAADVFLTNPWVRISTVAGIIGPLFLISVAAWQVRADVALLKNESYMKTEAERDALRQAMENPGMRVPNPNNAGEIFEVQR